MSVNEVDLAFKTIYNKVKEIMSQLKNVETSIIDMQVSKNVTLESIERISSFSQHTAATAEEIFATVEEQTARVEELSNYARELDAMAIELDRSVSIFKL